MKKGISWYIVFIVALIAIAIGGIFLVLWNVLNIAPKEANKLSCQMKYFNYCFRWATDKRDPGDWDRVNPTEGCENFGIEKPSEEDCRKLFPF